MDMDEATRHRIEEAIQGDQVVLFMKGRRRMPQCGFSAQVVGILDQMLEDYTTINVLTDAEVRDGIKIYSNWPTIPQLYVNGKFIGGCDIITEMFEQGELQSLLGVEEQAVHVPRLEVSDAAATALKEAMDGEEAPRVRLTVDARFRPTLGLDGTGPLDMELEANGIPFVVDRGTAGRVDGLRIDFVPGEHGGFRLDNPNEPAKVRAITPQALSERLKAGERFELIDVRTPEEQTTASIQGFQLLDEALKTRLLEKPKDTAMVFQCHHGGRSQAAAEYFLGQGFTQVFNLEGGIDAWSLEVDSSIPRY